MIDEDSTKVLGDLGFRLHTNRVDHAVLLNPDGTCVYRGYDRFVPKAIWFEATEERAYEGFQGEWSRLWPGGILGGHSWYIWRPGSVPFIMGPYDSTNGLSLEQGELYKNRWNRWHFIDTDQGGEELVDSFGTHYRYEVRLCNPALSTAHRSMFVGMDECGMFLWCPVEDNTDGLSVKLARMIRFRKVGKSSEAPTVSSPNPVGSTRSDE